MATARRSYSGRNRPVTACSECTRRKQKCDRGLPCHNCVRRGVENKCFYRITEDMNSSNYPTEKRKSTARDSTPDQNSPISSLEWPNLSEYIGYSRHGTHALSALDQLLDGHPASPSSTCAATLLNSSQWENFMRLIEVLPPTEIVKELVEVFFHEANWYFAVLDQYFFDSMHMRWITFLFGPKTSISASLEVSHFAALLLQIIALALQFLPPGNPCEDSVGVKRQEDRDEMSLNFSQAGEALVTLLGRHYPTITSIQADLLRCAWLKNCGRGAEAWNSLEHAVKQAQELGLHLNPDLAMDGDDMTAGTLRASWYCEHKRRLWVTLFIWESHMSLQLGRPRMINASDCTLTDPIDCDFPFEPARTLFRVPDPGDRPSSYTLQLVKYKVGLIIHRMMSAGAMDPLLQDYGIVQSFQDDISELLASLPPAMQPEEPDTSWDLLYPGIVKQRLQISIFVYSFLIALHRPHASRHVCSRRNAIDAAIRSLAASHELYKRSQPHHYKIYTLVFTTIDSGIFLVATAIKHYTTPSEMRQNIFETLGQAIERLGVLKGRNIAAQHGEKVLAKCVQKFRQAWTEHREQAAFRGDQDRDRGVLRYSALPDSRTRSEVSPGTAVLTDAGISVPAVDYNHLLDGLDLSDENMNATVSTVSWLENRDMLPILESRFDESDYIWD